jgi:hypothetical protein
LRTILNLFSPREAIQPINGVLLSYKGRKPFGYQPGMVQTMKINMKPFIKKTVLNGHENYYETI